MKQEPVFESNNFVLAYHKAVQCWTLAIFPTQNEETYQLIVLISGKLNKSRAPRYNGTPPPY